MNDSARATDMRRPAPNTPNRSGPARMAVFLAVLCGALPIQAEQPADEFFRIGFTRNIFVNQNRSDMLAAMKSWSQTISKERDVNVDPDMSIFETVRQAEIAVREKRLDALTLLLEEYSAVPNGLLSGPFFRDEVQGSTHVEFVLLVRADAAIKTFDDLRGGKLAAHEDPNVRLGIRWLEAQLAESGLVPLRSLVTRFDLNSKLSAAVLSVFFGKNDACLVTRVGFDSMVELNPQLSKRLVAIAVSPPVIPSFFCFRADLAQERKRQLFSEVLRLDESVTGRQVLSVFKADRMAEVTLVELDRSLALINRWKTTATSQPASMAGSNDGERPEATRGPGT